jgi:four helix bundle protein
MSGTFEDLRAWQCAMSFVVRLYRETGKFPKQEIYGLTSQLRKAAVSIASNIAEGKGRASDRDFCHFLDVARGSAYEVKTQLMLAAQIGYLDKEASTQLLAQASELSCIVNGLLKALRPRHPDVA